eukprot:Skav212766  [mRNA]  locus=scaffold2545:486315:486737:- [translate_table: standard]
MCLQNAPYDKIYGIFLSVVLFRPKATRTSRYLLCTIESSRVLDVQSTIYPLLEVVKNSLNLACEDGAGGRRFLVTELRGDQSWFRYIFRHKSWWVKNEVCFRCAATARSGPTCYVDYDANIPLRTTEEFILDELPNEEEL